MSVYFIRSGDLVKIGFSQDVQRRVASVLRMTRDEERAGHRLIEWGESE